MKRNEIGINEGTYAVYESHQVVTVDGTPLEAKTPQGLARKILEVGGIEAIGGVTMRAVEGSDVSINPREAFNFWNEYNRIRE